jgi:outer membrane protein
MKAITPIMTVGSLLALFVSGLVAPAYAQSASQRPSLAGDSLTLSRAIELAVDRSRDVRAASLSVQEAGHLAAEAWSNVYPRVDLNASYTRNIAPPMSFVPAQFFNPDAAPGEMARVQFGADNSWNSTIQLEQPLFQARAFLGVGAAGRFQHLQEEMLRGATQGVVTRVRIAFYDVLLAQEQTRLIESSVERVRASLNETRSMHRAGLASEYDVLRLEVELANIEPNVRRSQNAIRQARRTLAVELAMPEIETAPVSGTLAEMVAAAAASALRPAAPATGADSGIAPTSAMADGLVALALQSRSDIRQLELTRSLRRTELRAEQLEYAPKVSLFASYVINAQQNGGPRFFGASSMERSFGRLAGVSVSMPLFSGFKENARVGQSRAVVRGVENQLALARDRAEAEVRSLAERIDEAESRAAAQQLAVRQARRGFDIVGAQHREGLSGQMERTDAEVALRQSEFNYAQALYDYLVALAQLDHAMGRADDSPGRRATAGAR